MSTAITNSVSGTAIRRLAFFALLAIGLAAGVAGRPAATVAAGADASAFVQSVGDEVVKILQQNLPRAQAEQQLDAVWLQAFDTEGIGKTVLGNNWKKASEEQRKAYLDIFPRYVARIYAIQFSDYSGETFEVSDRGSQSGADTVVHAKIVRPNSEPIKVDFIVRTDGGALKIKDVKVEGMSLLITKRSEFDSVVAQKGIDGLIQAMRDKVG